MIKAIIVDDEDRARHTLSTLIKDYCSDLQILAECSSVPEAVIAINKLNPEIVFLDIEMPEYNGFELLDFIKEVNFEIIFVTAYSQYAIKAFEVSAVDYILKPIEIENLKNAVAKARLKRQHSNIAQRLDLLKNSFNGEEIKKIAFSMNDGLVFSDINEIILFEADRSYTHVYLKNGSKLTVSKPMRTFEEILVTRTVFFRPHRSYLINLNYIKSYRRGESEIIMDNNYQLSISREKKSEFESLLRELKIAI